GRDVAKGHRRPDGRAGARVAASHQGGRGITHGVETRYDAAVAAQHPGVFIRAQTTRGAEVTEDDPKGVIRRLAERIQIGVGQSRVAVVIVVNAVTPVEVVVVAAAGQLVETSGGVAQLPGRHPDLGCEFIPAFRRLDYARLQPGFGNRSPGGYGGARNLRQRKMSADDVAIE